MAKRLYSIKELAKLERKKYRDEEGIFLAEGKKVIAEALHAGLPISQYLATDKFVRENLDFFDEIKVHPRDITQLAEHNAARLSGTKTPPGVFAVVEKPQVWLQDIIKYNFIAVFENVRDPGNLGTMLRTADWFGVKAIMVSSDGVDPYHDKVIRATMGSLFHLQVYSSPDLAADLRELKEKVGFKIIVTRPEGEASVESTQLQKFCLVLGNESTGTSAEVDGLADQTYAIPKYGEAESLNVAVSFGIALHQLVAKMKSQPVKGLS